MAVDTSENNNTIDTPNGIKEKFERMANLMNYGMLSGTNDRECEKINQDSITCESSNQRGMVFEKVEPLTYYERDAGSFPNAIT